MLHKIQISVSQTQLYRNAAAFIGLHLAYDCFHTNNGRVERLGQKPYSQQSLNYLLSSPLQNVCLPLLSSHGSQSRLHMRFS